jgi:hypothetical protein
MAHSSLTVKSPMEVQPAIQKEFAAMSPLVSTHLYRTLRSCIVFNGGTTLVLFTAKVNSVLLYPFTEMMLVGV